MKDSLRKFGIDKAYQVSEFRVDRTRGIFSDTWSRISDT
jgi:hypothetical protein